MGVSMHSKYELEDYQLAAIDRLLAELERSELAPKHETAIEALMELFDEPE